MVTYQYTIPAQVANNHGIAELSSSRPTQSILATNALFPMSQNYPLSTSCISPLDVCYKIVNDPDRQLIPEEESAFRDSVRAEEALLSNWERAHLALIYILSNSK